MNKDNSQIAPVENGFSLISRQKLLALYFSMVRCRSIAERSGSRTKNNDSVAGHEAAAVGAAIDLLRHDTVVATLWPEDALRAINPTVSIAPSISVASRSAPGDKDDRSITVLFSSSRRVAQSSWVNALTLAAGHTLPFLFVNLSGPTAIGEIAGSDFVPMNGRRYSMPLIAVDGNDVVAVYRVASEAITHARKGHGPTLIDCQRPIAGDPLKSMEKYLLGKGLQPTAF